MNKKLAIIAIFLFGVGAEGHKIPAGRGIVPAK